MREDARLSAHPFYNAKATEYLVRAKETIDWLNAYFMISAGPNRLSYAPNLGGSGGKDAVHVDATMMRVQLDYSEATGDAAMLANADRLARTLRDIAIYTNSNGVMTWQYGYDGTSDPDDCSHGAYAGPHIAHIIRNHGVVTEAQGEGLARALIEHAFLPGGYATPGIDGTPYLARSNSVSSGHWSWGFAGGLIALGQFDMRLIPLAETVQLRNWGLSTNWPEFGPGKLGWPLMGIGNLVRYSVVPRELRLEMVVQDSGRTYRTTAPVHANLLAPREIVLVDDQDAGETARLSVSLSGRGDEWARWWELSINLDLANSPGLIGAAAEISLNLLDALENTKRIEAVVASSPGYIIDLAADGSAVLASGSLGGSARFTLRCGENDAAGSLYWSGWSGENCCLPLVATDIDCDGDVDQSDFGRMQACFSGPLDPVSVSPIDCRPADVTADGHVDAFDLVRFRGCVSGAGIALDVNCMN